MMPLLCIRYILDEILSCSLTLYGQEKVIRIIKTYLDDFAIQILKDQLIPSMEELFTHSCPMMILTATENRTRLENSLHRWMRAICSLNDPFPMVIILDDIQWATETCVSLLRYLLHASDIYALFICTHRPTKSTQSFYPVHQFSQAISASVTTKQINLNGFHFESTSQLIADMIGAHSKSIFPLATAIFDKTKGNPFFITQVTIFLPFLLSCKSDLGFFCSPTEYFQDLFYMNIGILWKMYQTSNST